jgi:hypothetical protein
MRNNLETNYSTSWNSAIFPSIPFVAFPVAGVTKDFRDMHDDWEVKRPILDTNIAHNSSAIYALHESAKNFTPFDNFECMSLYTNPLQPSSELVLVAKETAASNNNISLAFGWISGSDTSRWDWSTAWICSGQSDAGSRFCSIEWAQQFQDDWIVHHDYTTPDGQRHVMDITVDHCLVGEQSDAMLDRCGLHYNSSLLILICLLTFLDCTLVLVVLAFFHKHTLVLIGDVIAEALEIGAGSDESISNPQTPLQLKPNIFGRATLVRRMWPEENAPRWYQAVSWKTWLISITLYDNHSIPAGTPLTKCL